MMNNTLISKKEIKPYCSICANNKDFEDMKTTHNTKQHNIFYDVLGDE